MHTEQREQRNQTPKQGQYTDSLDHKIQPPHPNYVIKGCATMPVEMISPKLSLTQSSGIAGQQDILKAAQAMDLHAFYYL